MRRMVGGGDDEMKEMKLIATQRSMHHPLLEVTFTHWCNATNDGVVLLGQRRR